MSDWIYCHKCYAPAGAEIGLPEPGHVVIVSYTTRDGKRTVGMGEYTEEDVLITHAESEIVPPEGMRLKMRSFTIFDDDEAAAIPFDTGHVYYEQNGDRNYFTYIGYAWKPLPPPAPSKLTGFPEY